METMLRPMSLGEILDRTATIYRKNFLLLAGISALYSGVVLFFSLIHVLLQQFAWDPRSSKGTLLDGFYEIAAMFIYFVASAFAIAAINRSVSWIQLGEAVSIHRAYGGIRNRIGRYLWLMFLMGLRIYWPFFIAFVPLIFMIALAPGLRGNAQDDGLGSAALIGILGLVTFLLMLCALAYGIWQGLRLALSIPASVVEDLKARPAMRRSIELSSGARGRIFLLGLLVIVLDFGLIFLVAIPIAILNIQYVKAHHGHINVILQVIQLFLNFFITSFITPIYSTGFMLFYYDQRVRKEGFDIEWMMQSAGLSAPVAGDAVVAVEPPPLAVPSDGAGE